MISPVPLSTRCTPVRASKALSRCVTAGGVTFRSLAAAARDEDLLRAERKIISSDVNIKNHLIWDLPFVN
jgi:hypothetical protein